MKEVLKIENVSGNFSELETPSDVSLGIYEDEIFGLTGPNDAGKAALFNAVSSSSMPSPGKVYLNGKDMTERKATDYALEGFARTLQNIRVLSRMTVLENIAARIHKNVRTDPFFICMDNKKQKEAEKQVPEKAMEILRFLRIERSADETVRNLPYGTQHLAEIARALAGEPKLLLLDEPIAGMNQQEAMELMMLIQKIRKQGPAVLVTEHNTKFIMSSCHRIAALNFGQLLTLGEPVAMQNDPQVVEVCLGNNEEEQHTALEVKDLVIRYGEILVLRETSLIMENGKLTTLINSNGVGKSILLKTISGFLKPVVGGTVPDGREIGGMEADKIVTLGISQRPEGRKVSQDQAAYGSLKIGAFTRKDNGVEADTENHLNTLPRLRKKRSQPIDSLSGEEQQIPVTYRVLIARSKLLLLDGPSMGPAPIVVQEVSNIIKGINAQGTPMLLAERNAKQALRTADYGYVLEIGNVVTSDTAEDLLVDKAVQEACLGGVQTYERQILSEGGGEREIL